MSIVNMMEDETLSKYKSDHLILLVGGNPLPNAVVGYLLVKPNGTITLLHSGNTAVTAQKLYAWLNKNAEKRQIELTILFKEVDETSPTQIANETVRQLNSIQAEIVGLNYTGGTKAMSVHAYRAVEQWANGKKPTIYSYLNADTLSLVVDTQPKPIPLAGCIRLDFADLLALHGWALKPNTATTALVLPKFAQALLKLYSDNNLAAWETWKAQELRAKCQRDNRKWLSKTKLNQITLNWPQAPELAELAQALQEELQQGPNGLEIQTAVQSGGFKKPEYLCKQLDGGYWLETVVLQDLQSIADTHRLHDVSMNIRIPTMGDKDFELDVVAVRDYQLYGFSCGTDSDSASGGRERLKLKLFEAYVRAQQLGGDEARAALVCSADDPTGLEAEMRRDLSPHIKVFGRKHLANLATEFARWIQSESSPA